MLHIGAIIPNKTFKYFQIHLTLYVKRDILLRERHSIHFDFENNARIDLTLTTEKGEVIAFALNLSLEIGDKIYDVYRVDTAHGYLHEQKFWISPKPRRIDATDLKIVLEQKKKQLKENYLKWIELFKKKKLIL